MFGIFFLWERWAADLHKAPVRRKVTKWEEPTIWKTKDTWVSCEPHEGSQASAVFKELPPRQGVWVYFLDQDLGYIRGQLKSTFLQYGGFNVGSGPPKHSQLYFWELSLLPLRGHPQPDFNGTLEGAMEIVSVIPSLPHKAPLCKHSWRKYSNKKNNSSTCYQWYRK